MIKFKELKRRDLIKMISIIIILVIINLIFLRTSKALWSKNIKLKLEINKERAELAKGSNISSLKETLNLEINQLNSKLSSLEERFFPNTEDIFMYINRFVETSGISLTSMEPLEKIQGEIPYSKNLYLELPINIKLKCDYYQLLKFLNNLERTQKSIVVSEIKIQSDPKNIWDHDIRMLLKVPVLLYSIDK